MDHPLTLVNDNKELDLVVLEKFIQYNNGIEYAPPSLNSKGVAYNSNSYISTLLHSAGIEYEKILDMKQIAKGSPGYDKIITDKYWHQSYDTTLSEMRELGGINVILMDEYESLAIDYAKKGQKDWIMNQPHNRQHKEEQDN